MMKTLLTIAAILISSISYGQGIWTKSTANVKQNRLMADSVLIVPRDTGTTNNALYQGNPQGDSGRIAWMHGKLWVHNGTAWDTLSSGSDLSAYMKYSDSAAMLLPYARKIIKDTLDRFTFSGFTPSFESGYNAQEGILCTLNGDTLINVFRLDSARQHAGGKGQIVQRYSYDNGLTWANPTVIFDDVHDDRNVAGGKLSSGRIVVFFRQYDGNNTSGSTVSVGRIYSDDDGATWSSYTPISGTALGNRVFFGGISLAGDGDYKVSLYATDSAFVFTSTDGDVWSEQSQIFDYGSDPKLTSETAISYIGDDRMIALTRDDATPDSVYLQHISSDNGDTWAYVGRTNMNSEVVGANRTPPFLLYDDERNILISTSTTRNSTANGAPYLYRQDSLFVYINRPDSIFNNPVGYNLKFRINRPMPAQFAPFYGYPFITRLNNGNYFGVITEMATKSIADTSSSYEYDYLYQFDINFNESGTDSCRYSGLIPSFNLLTGNTDYRSDLIPFRNGLDTLSMFSFPTTLRIGTLANQPSRDAFQLVDNNGLRVFRFLSDGKIIAGKPTGNDALFAVPADGFNFLNEVRGFNASTGAENWRFSNSGLFYLGTTSGSDRINIAGNGNITGNWSIGGNLTVTGNSVTSAEFRGSNLNGNSSSGSLRLIGGAVTGFKGGSIDLIAGAAGANPGTISFRSGTTGGGADQSVNMRLDALGKLSVGGDNPISTLDVNGSTGFGILVTSSSTALTAAHSTVIVTSTSASITLPSAGTATRRIYRLINYNSGGNVTISSVNRDGSATTTLPNNAKWTVQSDGTNWYVIQD